MGEIALQNRKPVEVAYHLREAGDERAEKYYHDAAHIAFRWGYRQLAKEFFTENLSLARKSNDRQWLAHANFGVAQFYIETTQYVEGLKYADTAVALFREAGEELLAKHVESWINTAFLHELDPNIVIQQTKEALDYISSHPDHSQELEMATLVNLSYIFVRTSRFSQGITVAQKAYELAKSTNNRFGMIVSMTNIAACLGGLGNREQQYQYATMIIDTADELNNPRLRAAGLNHLAICQRKDNRPDEARISLEECITIAHELGDIRMEVTNINNLGNVYFDLDNFDEATKLYTQALYKAREYELVEGEAWSLELLARVQAQEENYGEVLRLSHEAIKFYELAHNKFRIASTLEYVAWAHAESGDYFQAAESSQKAAEIYKEFETFDDAAEQFENAGKYWIEADSITKAKDCLREGIRCALVGKSIELLNSLLKLTSEIDRSRSYGENYLELLRLYIQNGSDKKFAHFVFGFTSYLKSWPVAEERISIFIEGINELLAAYHKQPEPNLLNALALAIEQADTRLLDESNFNELADRLVSKINGFYWRRVADNHEIYTVSMRWKTDFIIQINCLEPDLTTRRLAFALAVILVANRKFIESSLTSLGGIQEPGFVVNLVLQSDFEKNIMKLSDQQRLSEDAPFIMSESKVPWGKQQPDCTAILHDEYNVITDYSQRPNNPAFAWVLMIFYGALLEHASHQSRYELAEHCREFADVIL